ncbi:MAG: hypothetical protein MPW15_00525 [Candidatus Manganitrophus sp.]|nr:hypothetical protein [Candidatus Manganitrophus sp.]
MKIFTESNQADEGPAESYFFRDKEGISYFGGQPTTPFESQLVPYRVIRFPLILNKPFSQIDKSISFGRDLDEDGKEETAVVQAEIVARGFETVSVPAGVFKDSLKLEGTDENFHHPLQQWEGSSHDRPDDQLVRPRCRHGEGDREDRIPLSGWEQSDRNHYYRRALRVFQ